MKAPKYRTVVIFVAFAVSALILLYMMNRFTDLPSTARIAITIVLGLSVPTVIVLYLNYTA